MFLILCNRSYIHRSNNQQIGWHISMESVMPILLRNILHATIQYSALSPQLKFYDMPQSLSRFFFVRNLCV